MTGRTGPFRTLIFILTLIALPSLAQITSATIRGKVLNERGNTVSNAEINAVGTQTGFVRTVHSAADGGYVLGGLTPGEYNIVVAAAGYEPRTDTVTIRVGQTLDVNLRLSATAVVSESITVVGNQLIETKTSEAATNITPVQMESLPQNERNFLTFAQLAPGIRLSNDPQRKTIASDAQPAEQTNVFIDGVSMKNDVLQGGVSGQDSSRGNPFPQNAVQEFRVITNNYSAQYEKASSAIITAVTKTGGNSIDGQAFVFWQPKGWVAPSPLGFGSGVTLTTNASYHRWQTGFNIGGPIIRDKLHYFAAYEGDDEHATTNVVTGGGSQFAQYNGVFASPFRSSLFFGKLSWQPFSNQIVDFSGNWRHEHEIRDFGGQTTVEASTNLRNAVYGATLRHSWNSNSSLNQASASLQRYYWNPTPVNPGLIGLNYQGAARLGGNSTTQDFDQRRLELRDDYNFAPIKFSGDHNIQVGANIDWARYAINKSLFGNPEYEFTNDPGTNRDFTQPFEVNFGFGNPFLRIGNHEYGLYGQDNWIVNPHLSLSLGLRWDYETNMLDQNYVTPANVVTALTGQGDPAAGLTSFNDYFSNGNSRSPYKNEFQPRLGFTYDVRGDSKTVVFGGAGRYYDRLFLNSTLDERYRLQFPVYRIEFSKTGDPRFGGQTIKWDPAFFTQAGLNALIASGQARPEVYLLNNNTKPPYSNQFNLGVRQTFGDWVGSASYNGVRGYHGFTWVSAAPSGLCCAPLVPGLGNTIISDPYGGKRYWFDGLYFSADRPFTNQSGWGAHFAWTHARATQNGNDLFSLDYPTAGMYPRHTVEGTEKDRIVATGIFGLPMAVRLSTILSFGTGAAKPFLDFTQGFSLANRQASNAWGATIYPPKTWGFADRTVDLRLEKDFPVWKSTSLGIVAEGFNVFNFHNYGCLSNFLGPNPSAQDLANVGTPGCVINLGRREQIGLRARF